MTETDTFPPPTSIADRIAALKLDQVGRDPTAPQQPSWSRNDKLASVTGAQSLQTRPSNRPVIPTSASEHILPIAARGARGNLPAKAPSSPNATAKVAPALPARRPADTPSPSLPPQRQQDGPALPQRPPSLPPTVSAQSGLQAVERRGSQASIASNISALSLRSPRVLADGMGADSVATLPARIVNAPVYESSKLPQLPPRRQPSTYSPQETGLSSSMSLLQQRPCLPIRSSVSGTPVEVLSSRKSALSQGFSSAVKTGPVTLPSLNVQGACASAAAPAPRLPSRPARLPTPDATASTLMTTSEAPDLSKLRQSKPNGSAKSRSPTADAGGGQCLLCWDFRAPDARAAQFPRAVVPNGDLSWLAHQLCSPFESRTEKTRAISTWLHLNINYNVRDFLGGCVKPSTPQSTFTTGLAVCEGYAALFSNLATHAGLASVVISGHGKGYGHTDPVAGQPLAPFEANHAWNAVQLEGGVWKLLDPCWIAGYLDKDNTYKRKFSPKMFTMSNEQFGTSHYPSDRQSFFRADRRRPSWEEYMLGTKGVGVSSGPQMYGDTYTVEEGIDPMSFKPRTRTIRKSEAMAIGPTIRVSFARVCPHWTVEKNGKGRPYVYVVDAGDDFKPMSTDGYAWWMDVPIGTIGDAIKILVVTKRNNLEGRDITAESLGGTERRVEMAWAFVASWEVTT